MYNHKKCFVSMQNRWKLSSWIWHDGLHLNRHQKPRVHEVSFPGTLEGSMVSGSSPSELNMLSVDQLHGGNRSPSLTPKASLTPTNSLDSTASTNGRTSPNISVAAILEGESFLRDSIEISALSNARMSSLVWTGREDPGGLLRSARGHGRPEGI